MTSCSVLVAGIPLWLSVVVVGVIGTFYTSVVRNDLSLNESISLLSVLVKKY